MGHRAANVIQMNEYFEIHPIDPQPRRIQKAVDIMKSGGVIVYPTDSCYALGCRIGDRAAQDRIRQIRGKEARHPFSLLCRDLSDIATYARVDNQAYRILRQLTPGPYTFVLKASREVPRKLQNPSRKTIGIRVPDNRVTEALLDGLGAPLMSSTLRLPGETLPLNDPDDIRDRLHNRVDGFVMSGAGGLEMTTVIDLAAAQAEVIRYGKGPLTGIEGEL